MITEEHKRDATRYYPFHDQVPIFGNITFGLRFYEFDDLIRSHQFLSNGMLNIQCVGNLQYSIFLEPPAVNPYIKENERDIFAISTSHGLNLRAVPFAEQYDLGSVGKLLLKLFAGERSLKMLKERGWHLRVICPSSELRGKRIVWLPEDPNVGTVNFLVDHPSINCRELWASIIPLDERLTKCLAWRVKDTPFFLFRQSTNRGVCIKN